MADWLRWYDSLEPLEITADEETEFEACRRKPLVSYLTIINKPRAANRRWAAAGSGCFNLS
jgi:hypothetical protein